MAWQIPMVNQILPDIKNISIYLRSVKKWGKTTLFRDVIIAKYGDPKKGLLVKCGNESGDTMLDNIYSTQIETYKDLVELGNWLITKKGIEHDIEIVAFDTVDELVLICDKETIARYKEESGKPCKSIKGAFGGFGARFGQKFGGRRDRCDGSRSDRLPTSKVERRGEEHGRLKKCKILYLVSEKNDDRNMSEQAHFCSDMLFFCFC